MRKPMLFRVLAGLLASLFAVSLGLATIANANETWMNSNLGTTNREVVISSENVPYYFESSYSSLTDVLQAKYDLIERISEEGSVLLKNNGALPLGQGRKVTLLGQGTVNTAYGGFIGSTISAGGTATIVSLQQALNERGFSVNPKMEEFYAANPGGGYYSSFMFGTRYEDLDTAIIGEVPVSAMVEQGYAADTGDGAALTAETIGEYSDAGIVVITRGSSEAAEYNVTSGQTPDGDSYDSPLDLTAYEKQLIDLAVRSFDTVVVLLNTDLPMGIESIKDNAGVDAILWVGLPGAKGFYGVADVLNGSVNPSGHLTDTFAVHPASAPSTANMGMFTWSNASVYGSGSQMTSGDYGKGDWYVVENEGIYIGYKYYETRYADAVAGDAEALNNANATSFVKGYADYDASAPWNYNDQVSYGFGYGLSYTTFTQTLESVAIDPAAGTGTATVSVSNTGSVDGKCAVQLYVQAPYTKGGVEKSAVQLVDFTKVSVAAGETVSVEVPFELANFASFDESAGKWILDGGQYYFAVGNGAHEALNSILLSQGTDLASLSISTEEENPSADAVCAMELGDVSAFLSTLNTNVQSRLADADWRTYDPNYQYMTRSNWSLGWETIGAADGTSADAIAYTAAMEAGLFGQQYTINANDRTADMNYAWNAGNGLRIYDFIGVGLNETITKDGVTYTYDDLVNNMSLYEACFTLENEYQNLDAIPSIGMEEVVTNDGPAGFAYDQVPGYAFNWAPYETYDKYYVSASDENAATSMSLFNTEPVVASTWNKDLVREEGAAMGEDALWADENAIIGPGVNLHRSPFNARNHEYYSEDSVLTSLMAAAVCEGGYSKGLMMQAKHYAFNHQEVNRAGTATFFDEQAGRENELRCFQKIMSENLTQSIMTAFNRVGTLFAGACESTLVGIARDEWGFEGFVVSDMVNGAMYMNWLDGFAYGMSGMLATNGYAATPLGASTSDENQASIAKDAFLQQRIHDAVKYMVYQVANSNFMNGMDTTVQVRTVTPWWKAALTAAEIVTGIGTAAFVVLYVISMASPKKKNG